MPGPKPIPAYDRVMRRSHASRTASHGGSPCIECTLRGTVEGYPFVGVGGTKRTAASVVWQHFHGRPDPGTVICHECDNRLCVNISHLTMQTFAEKAIHSIMVGRLKTNGAKLTAGQADEIRRSGKSARELAVEFGIKAAAIRNIKSGKSWRSDNVNANVRLPNDR